MIMKRKEGAFIMTYQEVMAQAKGSMGKCKACPVCNGQACRNTIPGPGAKGVGDTAIRNYDAWQKIRVNMDTLCPCGDADTSFSLFGRTFAAPVFAGPVGAVTMHYSDKYNDQTYNAALVSGCAQAGIAAFTGDGLDANVMVQATKAIAAVGGVGVPTVKPWNMELIREKMALVRESGAFAVAMDVDAAGLPFLRGMNPPAGSKTVEQLRQIKEAAGLPFIVKGVMTVKGALKALEAGADAILVSNHGGRVRGDGRGASGDRPGRGGPGPRAGGRRDPHRHGCVPGPGPGRAGGGHCPALRMRGLRRRRGGRRSPDEKAPGRAGRHHADVRRPFPGRDHGGVRERIR